MPGSSYFDAPPFPLGGAGSFFAVGRYDRTAGTIDSLPNILPLEVNLVEGTVPRTARFAYVFDNTDPSSPFPNGVQELWTLRGSTPYIVSNDDELVVYEYSPDGTRTLVFDGFAMIPQVNLDAGGTAATFTAVGVAIRLWDAPIEGSEWRQSDDPLAGEEVLTGLPCWFNPNGEPNCTPVGHAVNQGARDEYDLFLDPTLPNEIQSFWTLPKLVARLLWTYNKDEEYVKNPSTQDLKKYLVDIAPKPFAQYYNVRDPSTYDTTPIDIHSFDASNMPFMDAILEQLHYYGYEIFFGLFEDENGLPVNRIGLYRKDGMDGVAPKELYYPDPNTFPSLADGLPTFDGMAVARDGHGMINEVAIETAPMRYEASFVLAPGFRVAAADATTANIPNYDHAKLATATADKKRAYRWFVFDEAGTGHWNFGSSAWVSGASNATSLDAILGAPAPDPSNPTGPDVPQYVRRNRPGLADLIATDDEDKPWRAELALSYDYTGPSPGVWDGTGTWRSLGQHGWKLLKEQLGIEITAPNPEKWSIPKNNPLANDKTADVVNVISAMANPGAGGDLATKRFFLRLTGTIEADFGIDAEARRRDASPSRFTVRRRVDARDHFQMHVIDPTSVNNTSTASPKSPQIRRDDTAAAKAKAQSLRGVHEFPGVAMELRVPWITHAIGIGDFLSTVRGLEMDLGLGDGGASGESPRYPIVTAVSWTCQDPQTTVIRLGEGATNPERA